MDSRLDKLKQFLESAVEGMSSEQWSSASPGQVVRGGVAGTFVSHLHRNDPGAGESHDPRRAAGFAALHGAARTDLGCFGIWSHTCWTQSTSDRATERLAGGEGAQRDRRKDCGDGCDHRAVRSALRALGLPARPSLTGPVDCDTVEKASSGAWATSPETASPASRKHDAATGLNVGKRGLFSK